MSKCRICGSNSVLIPVGVKANGYDLYKCSVCLSVITDQGPGSRELSAIYDKLFAEGLYEQHRVEFARLKKGLPVRNMFRKNMLQRVEKMTNGRRMMEIGGGTGSFGVLAKSRGWDYVDYDISQEASKCANELGLTTYTFEPGTPPPLPIQQTNVVVMWEVLEHVWNVHEYMKKIYESLLPGGLLIFSVPNSICFQRIALLGPLTLPPVHCNFFTHEALCKLLELHHFQPISIYGRHFYFPQAKLSSIVRCGCLALHMRTPETLVAVVEKTK